MGSYLSKENMNNNTVEPHNNIGESIKKLNLNGHKTLVVVDNQNNFLGTLSDGDIRKFFLKKLSLKTKIEKIYQKNAFSVYENSNNLVKIKKIFLKNHFDIIPVINKKNKLVKIYSWDQIFKYSNLKQKNNFPLVIMSGGKGSRMQPFTNILPKPLLPFKNKPIIDTIINAILKKDDQSNKPEKSSFKSDAARSHIGEHPFN